MRAVISLGANLGERRKQIEEAIGLLRKEFTIVAESQLHETEIGRAHV